MTRLICNSELLEYDSMKLYPQVQAFSTTRKGGCSTGAYASFNCSPYCGDEPLHVRQNLIHLEHLLPVIPIEWVIPHQTHGTSVLAVDEHYAAASVAERTEMLEGVDALMTNRKGFCLCISTADCIPLLLFDRRQEVVAVIHAGWRGTAHGITARTIESMKAVYGSQPQDIQAVIGPGISLEAFEVGLEVYEAFREAGFPMEKVARWYRPTAKWHIDLWAANVWMLQNSGVLASQIELAGICTYLQCNDFFSARRLGIKSGRILSGIMLNP